MFKNFSIKLSTQFALLTSALIGIIVLLMAGYTINLLNNIAEKSEAQSTQANKAISAVVIDIINSGNNNYTEIDKTVQNMAINNLLAYVMVEDKATKEIKYSSIKSLKTQLYLLNKKNLQDSGASDKEFEQYKNTYYNKVDAIKANIYIGFYSEPILKVYANLLINSLKSMVILFIIMGLVIASLMSIIVISPLNKLIGTIKEFANGNLKTRANLTKYDEINEMVNSYNQMADEIETLYTSMEQKVEERTEQLKQAYSDLQDAQTMMVHSEKMKSLGELVAGITHEINNPVNFIYGNLIHLNGYSMDLMNLIDKYISYEEDLEENHRQEIEAFKKDMDLAFLKTDLPELIRSCREGTERTKNIVMDLKNFSRMDEMVINSVDLEKEIDTTLNILHNKIKHRIEIHKEYDKNLEPIEGYGGQLNQVFMNILDNASYAIKESGDIWITIKQLESSVVLEFKDSGIGMDAETTNRIFDPFFTTKPPGEGTGLGMAISYKVIQNHNGTITVTSEKNKGTTFKMELPKKTVYREAPLLKEKDIKKENE